MLTVVGVAKLGILMLGVTVLGVVMLIVVGSGIALWPFNLGPEL
jgi:hypothetical protein